MPDNSSLFILLHPEIDLLSPSASCGDPACLIISQRFDKGGQLGISVITHIKIRKSFPKLVAQLSGGKPSLFVRKFLDDGINGLAHPLEIFVLPGAGAAITYMVGGDISLIKKTIENTLANIPGIICDGAKISCAAKIAACLDAAFLAHHLAMNGQSYAPYTGILQEETAETISCVGQIGKDGMKETDREILKIMLEH